MSKLKLPESTFFNDLYRDLRDRRLLIPAVALLVAIIAVPFVLGGGSEPAPAPLAPAASQTEGAEALAPAVLTEQQVGVRNYRERLSELKEKNPFQQKFKLPSPDDLALGDSTSTSTSTSTTTTDTTSGSTSISTDTTTDTITSGPVDTGTSTSDTDTTSTTTSPGNSGSAPGQADDQSQPDILFFASRVDVTVGPLGKTERIKGVKPLDLLPNKQAPVVAFLGLAGTDSAVFSISRDVVETDGEGECAPKKPKPCEFVTLKVGEERTFKYGPEGTPYRLKLLDTDVVRVADPRDSKPEKGKVAAQ